MRVSAKCTSMRLEQSNLSSFHTSLSIHSGKCSALILRHSPSYTEQNEKEKRMIWRNLETETGNLGILLIYIKHDIWAKSTNIRSTKIQNFTSGNVVWFVAISVRYESRVICILHMHGSHTFSITVFKTSSYKYIFVSVIKSISIWESEVRLTTCFNIVV